MLGAALVWFFAMRGKADHSEEVQTLRTANAKLSTQIEERASAHEEKLLELKEMRESAEDAFKVLAQDALKENRDEFLKGAEDSFDDQREKIEGFVDPLKKQLDKYEEHLGKMQKEHIDSSSANRERLSHLMEELKKQQQLATDLKGLLQGPTQRGRIAEMLLESMLERAGLIKDQHFEMQHTIEVDGKSYRPDCRMRMPGYGEIFIDVKAPLDAYKDAVATDDENVREQKFKEHTANVRAAIDDIASKPYKDASQGPALVIMYLPIEASLTVAQVQDPDIISYGWDRGVIVASPTLLFVLLQTVALAWQQERLRESTEEVKKLGTELVTRVRVVAGHLDDVGRRLDSTVKAYNSSVGSMDRMLFTTSRKFQELGASSDTKELKLRNTVVEIKQFEKPELQSPPTDEELQALTEIVVEQPELVEFVEEETEV